MSTLLEAIISMEGWLMRALGAAIMVAIPAALLGVLLYFRRMSMLPDALAHAALPGVAAGYLLTGGPSAVAVAGGALSSGLMASGLINILRDRLRVRPDAAVGVVYATMFALGVVLVSTWGRSAHIDVDCVLFGNLLGLADVTLVSIAIVAGAVCLGVAATHRVLAHSTFDAEHAGLTGLPTRAIDRGIVFASTLVCVAAFEAVGVVLVLAMFVLPAATAHQLARSFRQMLVLASAAAVAAVFLGLAASIVFDLAPAGSIACAGGIVYALSLATNALRRHSATLIEARSAPGIQDCSC